MMKKNLLIAGAMLLILTAFSVNKAQAQTCVMPPSCEDLGYTMTQADCASAEKILKCPHDQSKMFCLTMAEIDPGSSGNAGDILYEDHTTRADYVYIVDNRPIGVVFDPVNRLAIALDEVTYPWASAYTSPRADIISIPDLADCTTNVLTCGKSGKENTAIIMAFQTKLQNSSASNKNKIFYHAADYCYKYQPNSVSSVKSWFAAGQWFLPNVAELNILYQNKDKVNASLQKVNAVTLTDSYYWSSTEYGNNGAWGLRMYDGSQSGDLKSNNNYVRLVLAF